MSDARSTRTKTSAPQAEEAAVEGTKAELAKQGFVLEVTARDPDVRDADNNLVSKGKIFDLYHHPCSRKDCTHDPSTVGQWKKLAAADESRCVN